MRYVLFLFLLCAFLPLAAAEESATDDGGAKKNDGAAKEDNGDDDDDDGEFFFAAKAELGFGFSSVNSNAVFTAPNGSMFDLEPGIGVEGGYKFDIPFELGLGFAYRYRLLADGADTVHFGTGHSLLPYFAVRFYIPILLIDLYPDVRAGCDILLGDGATMGLFYGSVGIGILFLKFLVTELSYSFEIGQELAGANKIKNWRLNVFTVRFGVRF